MTSRRDPRAERLAQLSEGRHGPRLDRTQKHAAQQPAFAQPQQTAPARLMVENPTFLVAVAADVPHGALSPQDRQAIGAARILAGTDGAVLLIAAAPGEDAGAAGADRALAPPPQPDPACRAAWLATLLREIQPRHIVFPETDDGGDAARRLAARLGEAFFAGAERVTAARVTRRAGAGRMEQYCAPPRIITLAEGATAPYAGPPRQARPFVAATLPDRPAAPVFASVETLPAEAAKIPLAEADFVIAAGHGVTDFVSFHALAAALNATPGASRVLCDGGKMPHAAQVGASGTVLSGRCYLAFGIAGAPQHLQGVANMAHVIAINTDLHAAMIKRADLAIIADAQKIMPALLLRLRGGVS